MKRETFSRKDTAVHFLRQAAAGKVQQAYEHTTDDFIHHNPYFAGDKESLMKGMAENAARFPDKTLDVKHVLEDGDLVAVHSHVRMKSGDLGGGVVHIFRFENGRIAELWDLGQEVPKDSPNENGMF
jgi:predicted SnoaL-like aldol condensation-catalyzing enzyme